MSVNVIRVSPHRSKKGRIQRAVLGLLLTKKRNGEIPTNGRFVFYELEQQGRCGRARSRGRPGRTGWTLSAPRLSERARRSLRLVVARLLARLLRHDSNAVGAVRAFREDVEAEPCEPQRPELAARPIEGRVPGSTAVGCRSRKPIRLGGVNSNR